MSTKQRYRWRFSDCKSEDPRGYGTGQTGHYPGSSHAISDYPIGPHGHGCPYHLLLSCSTYTVRRCIHAVIVVWWQSGGDRSVDIVDIDIWLIVRSALGGLVRLGVLIDTAIGIDTSG
jgi:hypothetical protein